MEKIYKIFVSSTFEDLRDERSEVQKALLRMKCFPVGMELFPSTDEETWEFITKQIEDSDYYLLIIGGRYGSEDRDGVGFTEKEYIYAKENNKPTVAFIVRDRNIIEAGRVDRSEDKIAKLDKFISKVRSGPLVQAFSNPHELAALVQSSLINLIDRRPAVGFVRADQAIDPSKYARVLEENESLRAQVADLASAHKLSWFPGAEDDVLLSFQLRESEVVDFKTRWRNVFELVSAYLIEQPGVSGPMVSWMLGWKFKGVRCSLTKDSLREVSNFMIGRRLIHLVHREAQGEEYHAWEFTDYGMSQIGCLIDQV